MAIQTTTWQGGTVSFLTDFNTAANWSTGTKLTGGNVTGTAQAGAAGTITLAAGDGTATNGYVGYVIFITSGTGAGQWREITANNSSTKVVTVSSNWTVNPDNTSVYVIGDRGIYANSSFSCDTNLTQTGYASQIDIFNSFIGAIGKTSEPYLVLKTAIVNIGFNGVGQNQRGSQSLSLNLGNIGAVGSQVTILAVQTIGADGLTPVRLLGTNMTITQNSGQVSVALASGETSSIVNLNAVAGQMFLGGGVTVSGVISVTGGTVINGCNATVPTLYISNGAYETQGPATHGDITIAGGVVYYSGVGAITGTLIVYGTLDMTRGTGQVSVANLVLVAKGGSINDPQGRLVLAAGFKSVDCGLEQCGPLIFPPNKTVTLT